MHPIIRFIHSIQLQVQANGARTRVMCACAHVHVHVVVVRTQRPGVGLPITLSFAPLHDLSHSESSESQTRPVCVVSACADIICR